MDYEQKYNETLERAKKLKETCDSTAVIGWCEYIFPELKESEGEKIKKELIDFIKSHLAGFPQCEKYITWLEKQCEHHIVCSEEQMKVLDEVLNFAANHESPYWNNYIFETLNNLIRQFKTESIKL